MSRRAGTPVGLTVAVLTATLLVGCGGNKTIDAIAASSEAALATPAPSPAATAAPAETAAPVPTPDPEAAAALEGNGNGTVIDLTTMSATMVYAQVYDMVMTPADYDGQTFTVTGQYISYEGNPNNADGAAYYYTVSVADATACCQQGLEFVLPEGSAYPDENETITVTGVYTPYEENGVEYYHLVADGWTAA